MKTARENFPGCFFYFSYLIFYLLFFQNFISPLPGRIYTRTLYAGGAFSLSSSNFNVAKWNGTSWVAVGEGLQGVAGSEVKVFCKYNGALYAGGTFTQSGLASLSKVGKLNSAGTAWAQAGGGAPSKCTAGVHALAVHANELYAGGEGSAPWINKLDVFTSQWVDVGTTGALSAGTGVYALSTFKYPTASSYSLFVGGKFNAPFMTCCTYSNGNWGTAFNNFSGGSSDQVNCFLASSSGTLGALYAGGVFTVNAATNLARKPVSGPWVAEGTNTFSGKVRAMCYFNGYVVAGGDFTSPGSFVARFATTIGIDEVSENILVNNIFPNPVINEALLKVQTKDQLQQPELRMMDVNGKEISAHTTISNFNRATNEIEFRFDREGLASGIYYYMVLDEQRNIASGKFIVE